MNIDFNTKQCPTCTYMNNITSPTCVMCSAQLPESNSSIDVSVFSQALIDTIRQSKVNDNLKLADDTIPEAWIQVDMLYIQVSINDKLVSAFIDTGAQSTVISKKCAEYCGIDNLIDYRVVGKTVGVGEKNILGKIWCVDIIVGHYALPSCFTVLDGFGIDLIFGLDMLKKHKCNIDFTNNCMVIGDCHVPFIKKDFILEYNANTGKNTDTNIDTNIDTNADENGDLYT